MKLCNLGKMLTLAGLSTAALVGCTGFGKRPEGTSWKAPPATSAYASKNFGKACVTVSEKQWVPCKDDCCPQTKDKPATQLPALPAKVAEPVPAEQSIPKVLPPIAAETKPVYADPSKSDLPAFPRGQSNPVRKSFPDITAHSSFGHAADYTWISGEAQRWRKDWRLRYASVDEVDPHGGSLTLVGEEHLAQLKDGQHYKIIGRLTTLENRVGGPAFHVESVEVLRQE